MRRLTDPAGSVWQCETQWNSIDRATIGRDASPEARLPRGTPRRMAASASPTTVPVVCRAGARELPLDLPLTWEEELSDAELLGRIAQAGEDQGKIPDDSSGDR